MKVFDLKSSVDEAVLVMGTDGLWDVVSGEEVKATVFSVLNQCRKDDPKRCAFIFKIKIICISLYAMFLTFDLN